MPRIGFAESHYDSFTGAQQSLLPLMKDCKAYDSILFTPKQGQCVNIFESHNIPVKVIEYPEQLDRFGAELLETSLIDKAQTTSELVRYYVRVANELRKENIDLLCCNGIRSVFLLGPPARILGLPVVWYVRGDTSRPKFDSIGYYIPSRIVTISDGVRGKFDPTPISRSAGKFRTIYTGVDLDKFDPYQSYEETFSFEQNDSLNIVEVATVQPRKRQENLIKAMGSIKNKVPDFNLIFAGSTVKEFKGYKKRLQSLIEEEELEDNIYFLGWCDEIPTLLSKTDIFVLPSTREGFPRSILEASAMGVPSVATSAGGTDELVKDGETGFVVPIDDVEALADKITELCVNEKMREEFGQAARKTVVEKYSEERYINNFADYIFEVLL